LTLCNYIRPINYQNISVLDSIELEEKEQLRKKLNLAVYKLLQKILKLKEDVEAERVKLIELASSGD
jgi:hypothetical protein